MPKFASSALPFEWPKIACQKIDTPHQNKKSPPGASPKTSHCSLSSEELKCEVHWNLVKMKLALLINHENLNLQPCLEFHAWIEHNLAEKRWNRNSNLLIPEQFNNSGKRELPFGFLSTTMTTSRSSQVQCCCHAVQVVYYLPFWILTFLNR